MKYYIIAGEASGDLHGGNLIKALQKKDKNSDFRCWGGDFMQKNGGNLVKHYKDLAFMGFWEVLLHLRTILKNIAFCKKDLQKYQPDILILIDYPGFNMRIADFAKKKNIPVHYYISPKIWAWKENRIKKIKKNVDFLYVILPFEKDFYEKKHHFPVHFVGHPLIDALKKQEKTPQKLFKKQYHLNEKPMIALLPGSRKQEIKKILKEMLRVVKDFPEYQFIVAAAPSQEINFYKKIIQNKNVKIIENDTYNLLNNAFAALVTSGTATLETALFQVPQVVCYKGNGLSYQIAKRLIKIKYIGLVNLIMDKMVVKELIQNELNYKNLKKNLQKILETEKRNQIKSDYEKLRKLLGEKSPSQKVADFILRSKKIEKI